MSNMIIGDALPTIPWEDKPTGYDFPMWRYSQNPILDWNPIPRVARIFNSAVMAVENGYVGVFRADYRNGRPQLHFGTSKDALNWSIEHEMIAWKDESGQPVQNSYAYDPRIVKIDDTVYITWCDDFPGPSIGLGRTRDFKTFVKMPNPLMPFNRNGVLFPRKINGEYLLLSRPSDSGHTPFGDIFLSHSPDMIHWGKHSLVMAKGGQGWWQGTKVGAGPIPIETRQGWLLFYHGVSWTCNGYVYSVGAALLDLDDPSRVIYRTGDYLLTPECTYETTGFVPNVCFPCAALCDTATGRIALYYGAADTYTAVAFCQIDELLDYMKLNSEV